MNKIYLIHGTNSYLRKSEKNELIKDYFDNGGKTINSFTLCDQSDAQYKSKIAQKISGSSLFSQKELIVINWIFPEKPKGRTKKETKTSKTSVGEQFLSEQIKSIAQDISLIVEASEYLKKTSTVLKALQKRTDSQILEFNLPDKRDNSLLLKNINQFLAEKKIKINPSTIQKLIQSKNGDWWDIFSSLEKIALFMHTESTYKESNLEELLDLEEEQNIFWLLDSIGKGEMAKSFSQLYELNRQNNYNSGSEIEAMIGFCSLLSRQLKQLIVVKEGISPSEAQKEWQIPLFVFNKLRLQASKFQKDFLIKAYSKLAKTQEKVKSGLYNPLSLIDFLVFYFISNRGR